MDQPFVRYLVNGQLFVVPRNYKLISPIGQGAYGIVCSAWDESVQPPVKVAIKKITLDIHRIDCRRILREIKLLQHFNHENIIQLKDIFGPLKRTEFDEVYLVYDLMEANLNHIIKSDQELTDKHIQFFLYQILKGLKCIHSAGVLHRDLKPANILLNSRCDIKICDFGLARRDQLDNKTEYVQTRWYRAPELLLEGRYYSKGVDMWSVGCILAELLGRKPLFKGKDYIEQIKKIFAVIGTPDKETLSFISSPSALDQVLSWERHNKVPFRELFPDANPQAIDLLENLLQFDYRWRPTAEECLDHVYFEEFSNPLDEPNASGEWDSSYESSIGSNQEAVDLIFFEMSGIHLEVKHVFQERNHPSDFVTPKHPMMVSLFHSANDVPDTEIYHDDGTKTRMMMMMMDDDEEEEYVEDGDDIGLMDEDDEYFNENGDREFNYYGPDECEYEYDSNNTTSPQS
eukprot:gb/GECH01009921.1/.p1 GENE.gb/GECH01009921.1/~~gb/GECH01009921.1/.p1  ORF type:complete len:459 (+),score=102.78 gb/GECH01009921.1/:1-1377(+)